MSSKRARNGRSGGRVGLRGRSAAQEGSLTLPTCTISLPDTAVSSTTSTSTNVITISPHSALPV
eukprot:364570-Chlamydomonas_euryale.AAC.11